jgi:ribosomal protein S18 acetylase RimI-like enzyme
MTPPTIVAADTIEPLRLHGAFVAAFADYVNGPFQVPPSGWPIFVARHAATLAHSRVALAPDGEISAFALTALRPDAGRWRLATMGALPAARGSGAAPALLDDFIARAREAGQAGVELEVFAQNRRAFKLYRSRGFEALHELHGYRRSAGRYESESPAVLEVAPDTALAWLQRAAQQIPDLPMQVTAAALPAQWQAWQSGSAQLLFSGNAPAPLTIHSLIDLDPAQRQAQALAQALLARHPWRELQVPQLQRLDVGGEALRRLGFEPLALHQLWMRLDF